MAPETPTTFDIQALKRAWEAKEVEAILGFYADDAEIRYIDRNAQPKSPNVIDKEGFAEVVRDAAGRDLTTRVERAITTDDGAAVSMHCRYGDGTEVVANQVLDLRDGQIVRHHEVTVWDE